METPSEHSSLPMRSGGITLASGRGGSHFRKLTRIVLALFTVLLTACEATPHVTAPADEYSVRGIVRRLPKQPGKGSELFIHHESVPEFRDEDGQVVGMEAMAMPFPLAEDIVLDNLVAGDRIAFSFEVQWQAKGNPLTLTDWEKLSEETLLEFEQPPAEPDKGDQPDSGDLLELEPVEQDAASG